MCDSICVFGILISSSGIIEIKSLCYIALQTFAFIWFVQRIRMLILVHVLLNHYSLIENELINFVTCEMFMWWDRNRNRNRKRNKILSEIWMFSFCFQFNRAQIRFVLEKVISRIYFDFHRCCTECSLIELILRLHNQHPLYNGPAFWKEIQHVIYWPTYNKWSYIPI